MRSRSLSLGDLFAVQGECVVPLTVAELEQLVFCANEPAEEKEEVVGEVDSFEELSRSSLAR